MRHNASLVIFQYKNGTPVQTPGGPKSWENLEEKAGNGVGAVVATHGTLFRNYEIDEKGIIMNANCIVPKSQNLNNIERDMEKLVPEILDKSDEEITSSLEMRVRAYDSCISCSTNLVNVKFVNRCKTCLKSQKMKCVSVIGIGNSIMGDDGVGIHAILKLREMVPGRH